jgi:hypothetical protein
MIIRDLDPLQFFSSYFGHVVYLNHLFTYFFFLLKYFLIICNLTTIELRKWEKTLEKKLENPNPIISMTNFFDLIGSDMCWFLDPHEKK